MLEFCLRLNVNAEKNVSCMFIIQLFFIISVTRHEPANPPAKGLPTVVLTDCIFKSFEDSVSRFQLRSNPYSIMGELAEECHKIREEMDDLRF